RELLALGKNRNEIAELMGVTVGTLQVTCSKLGISLRQRRLYPQVDLPTTEVPATGTIVAPTVVDSVHFAFKNIDNVLRLTQQEDVKVLRLDEIADTERNSATLALAIEYRGRKRAIPFALSEDAIARLALEAQLREMSLGQLLGSII